MAICNCVLRNTRESLHVFLLGCQLEEAFMKRFFLVLVLLAVSNCWATIVTVTVSGLTFTPANITVFHGDTVRWNKTDVDFHNIAENSATPIFRSGEPDSNPFVYEFMFNTPLIGVYNYQCEVHGGLGMTGTVTVRGLKTVTLGGASFSPAAVTIQQGDTVRWVKVAGLSHNVREIGGAPDTTFYSGIPTTAAFTYDKRFLAPLLGTYNYRCDIHFSIGMVGTVTVLAPPLPPCEDPTDLMIKWEADNQVTLYWQAPQIGHYDVYSTPDATLATSPPGPGWTLAAGVDAIAIGQVSTIITDASVQLFFVVIQDCTP